MIIIFLKKEGARMYPRGELEIMCRDCKSCTHILCQAKLTKGPCNYVPFLSADHEVVPLLRPETCPHLLSNCVAAWSLST